MSKFNIGGQAVIEGVMMRGEKLISVAVRKPDGTIHVETKPATTIRDKYPILNKPFIRGMIILWESLRDGLVALQHSAQISSDSTEEEMTTKETVKYKIGISIKPHIEKHLFICYNLYKD